jgi:hypothetical protein
MLTRAQVAARLGKSIATVRRMEGIELHPRKGTDGVHRFNPVEVATVARAPRGSQWPISNRTPDTDDDEQPGDEAFAERDDQIRALERKLAAAQVELRGARRLLAENAELREALMLALDCIVEQLGPKPPRDVLELVNVLTMQYAGEPVHRR